MEKLSVYAFPSDSDEFLPPTPSTGPSLSGIPFFVPVRDRTSPSANLASTRRSARQERGSKRGSASQPPPQLHYKDWTTPKLLKILFERSIPIPFLFLLRIRKILLSQAQLPLPAQSTQPQHLQQSLTPPIPSSSSAPQVTFNQLQTLLQPIIDSQLALSARLDKLENPALAPPAFSSSTPAYTLAPPTRSQARDVYGRPIKFTGGRQICNNFNTSACFSKTCKYLHACSFCNDAHSRSICPLSAK
ncbi:UNVERIFIED_CONTAM: hypothetical protein FKN15_057561 [Acipenser sinensis]